MKKRVWYPAVFSEAATLELAFTNSIGRYGDGELRIALGGQAISQVQDPQLRRELLNLLKDTRGPCLPCIPNLECDTPKMWFWQKYMAAKFTNLYDKKFKYGSQFITRPDSTPWIDTPEFWDRMRDLWRGKDVVLVAGTERSLVPELMPEAKSIRRVGGPRRDAYAVIDQIQEEIGTPSGPVILCIGATATVLAHRLAKRGIHALDLGHLGMFMRRDKTVSIMLKSLISDAYLRQNQLLHEGPAGFGGSGWKQAKTVMEYAQQLNVESILDYGCGEGTLRKELGKLGWKGKVYEYDPAVAKKDTLPRPAELVVCTDVLEHIEPEHLEAVLNHLHSLATKAAYVVIATRVANKVLPDGRNAHLIVESKDWWLAKFPNWEIRKQDGKLNYDLKLWLHK